MSTHTNDLQTTAPTYPDAEPIGPHLVVDKTEWVPGKDPEPHRRYDGQRAYHERYYRCLVCGEERLSTADFPEQCDGARPSR
jgi:hypothetical protein